MTKWLSNFAYRVNITWQVFIISFAIATLVVLLTVFINAFKASRTNLVEALRYE
jgi:putative ABC transport system permease protein